MCLPAVTSLTLVYIVPAPLLLMRGLIYIRGSYYYEVDLSDQLKLSLFTLTLIKWSKEANH